jgi:hypothetical protein
MTLHMFGLAVQLVRAIGILELILSHQQVEG